MSAQIGNPWGLTAHGSARAHAAPDVARVQLGTARVEPSAAEAFAATRALVERIRAALRERGVVDEAVEESRLSLSTEYDGYGEERRFLGYRCEASFAVELRDLDALEPALVAATEAGANRVDGVVFTVADPAALEERARRDAVKAARKRAGLLAQAAGVRLGPVVHLEDLDGPEEGPVMYRAMAESAPGGGELRPGRVSVAARVVVGFAILRD
ncbi:SIMPL domain-containing protein [Phytomonospora sp. NPDC050363]|uniref:SIMPL domain-containing protein n=1 Tax=Phytomonospora sp. NPDC050363 TaxID=3155642 RepID=UPI00340021F9